MKKNLLVTLMLAVFAFCFSTGTQAAIHYITCGSGGWIYVSGQTVTIGDSIRFVNFCWPGLISFYQLGSTPCDYWETPFLEYEEVSFVDTSSCSPGTMYFNSNPLLYDDGVLYLVPPPTPTATPDPNLPAMSPAGTGVCLLLAGFLLIGSTLRSIKVKK